MSEKTVMELIEEAKLEVSAVTSEVLDELINNDDNAIILDVREKEENSTGRIKHSILIPRGMLEFLAEMKIPDKTSKLIVYCAKGPRSILAGKTLKTIGYNNVSYLEGGFEGWEKKEFEIEK